MRIQNNIAAQYTHRQLGINNGGQTKATEKLSSGYRINRAADDAAGLTISEKMRSQIRGLDRASMNAQDGISMIQAAEGALQECHSILQRMRELAVQGANDVLSGEERMTIKSEIDQLGMELDRIATTTNFNGKYMLSGQYQVKDAWNNIPDELAEVKNISEPTGTINLQAGAKTLEGNVIQIRFRGVTAYDLLNGPHGHGDPNWVSPYDPEDPINTGFVPNPVPDFMPVTDEEGIPNHNGFKMLLNVLDNKCPWPGYQNNNPSAKTNTSGLVLISEMRAELGAVQSRLEQTVSNVNTVGENTQSAESRIRDTDMAREIMRQTTANILNQSATAMLAQANQLPQTVLSLVK